MSQGSQCVCGECMRIVAGGEVSALREGDTEIDPRFHWSGHTSD